ncbi:hypothetical protein AB0D95_11500 [Streptomyces chilikensis]|uniref:Secreted protein n=1 Tax=Streptomyces chilikensis TaxID=1194079 RepID=A0ABV3ENV3_9ACTN
MSVVCALVVWFLDEPLLLRLVTALAAVVGVAAAVTLRRWDAAAGLSVAELKRAKAGAEWQHEERVAELEADLEESRELRTKLEQRLRSKRAELAALRNEHASLLRRYATAETERASALEGRRLLEIESKDPVPALPPVRETPALGPAPAPEPPRPFSPQGGELFRRAGEVLDALETRPAPADAEAGPVDTGSADDGSADTGSADDGFADGVDLGGTAEPDGAPRLEVPEELDRPVDVHGPETTRELGPDEARESKGTVPAADVVDDGDAPADAEEAPSNRPVPGERDGRGAEDDADGSTASGPAALTPARPAGGHFTVPTAVAVVPAAEAPRRPGTEGGFDFFGTQRADRGAGHPPRTASPEAPSSDVVRQPIQRQAQWQARQQQAEQWPRHQAAPQPRAEERSGPEERSGTEERAGAEEQTGTGEQPRTGTEGRTAATPTQPLIRTSPRTDIGRVIDVDA